MVKFSLSAGRITKPRGQWRPAARRSRRMPPPPDPDCSLRAMADISLPLVFFAGMLSFLTPCVLPLVPAYLSFLAGTTLDELQERQPDRIVVLRALGTAALFVLGFGTVFVLLGATASALGAVVRQYLGWLTTIAGIAIIVMGLHFLGVFRIGFLYREKRWSPAKPVG